MQVGTFIEPINDWAFVSITDWTDWIGMYPKSHIPESIKCREIESVFADTYNKNGTEVPFIHIELREKR